MTSRREESRPNDSQRLTRRDLLERAGLAAAAFAIPSASENAFLLRGQAAAPNSPASAMNPLSTYMSEAASRSLPEEVAEKTKHHILDTLAAMISGSNLLPGQRALQFAQAYGGKEICTVAASKTLCGAIEAALANGVLAHADETDDSHSPSQSHPGCAVVPAAHISCARSRSAMILVRASR